MDSEALVDVEVEFDYEAELGDELTIKAGDIIKDVKRMDGGWWEGGLGGRRGVFPDNFVKVITREAPSKLKQAVPPVALSSSVTSEDSSSVQLRRGQHSRASANNKKRCRVLFSYQPKHDDELELKLDDVVEFITEVEDGWWKGKLRGRVGVFPSNFVEMAKASNEDEQTVADKNKKNEKLKVDKAAQRPQSKISSLIQEAENKAKRKSSAENLNLVKRESPLGGEDNTMAKTDDLSNAPKLPPKPVKEQCVVIFPYNAVNDDELTLEEGQIVTIVSKDVEDKGWWKGEVDGRTGVFPDNFVKLISPTTITAADDANKVVTKKPTRPPGAKLQQPSTKISKKSSVDETTSSPAKISKKSSLDESSSASSSREKLNGSSDRLSKKIPVKKEIKQPTSLPPVNLNEKASPKKHSFGKSTPPPKPKPPAFVNNNKGSTGSLNTEAIKEEADSIKNDQKTSKEVDLDQVLRSDNKLAHPTAERVKAPKRRPPSSVFQKEAKLSGDAFEVLETKDQDNNDDNEDNNSDLKHKRSASQGSLHDSDHHLLAAARQESKNRLSFKMVKQTMKEALGNLSSSSNGDKSNVSSPSRKSSEEVPSKHSASKAGSKSPPKLDQNTSKEIDLDQSATMEPAKKPDWLAELSRKQANRRSGLFTTTTNNEAEIKTGTSPPKIAENKPTVAPDKPHIPLKPSQIREEARKSAVFPKRLSNESILGNGNNNNDKENNKPTSHTTTKPKPEEKPTMVTKVIESQAALSPPKITKLPTPVVVTTTMPSETVTEAVTTVTKPKVAVHAVPTAVVTSDPKPASIVTSTTAVGWKPAILEHSVVETKQAEVLSLEERVKRLEEVMSSMKNSYEAKFDILQKELEYERAERRKLEETLKGTH